MLGFQCYGTVGTYYHCERIYGFSYRYLIYCTVLQQIFLYIGMLLCN
jgi:hypothetical protein